MYFINKIKEKYVNENIIMFVDMDGVIAEYDMNRPYDFKNKRPVMTNINTLKEISLLKNIELHILSICREDYQIKDKQDWLNKYASFFLKNNRVIISKESNPDKSSKELKYEYLKNYLKNNINKKVILIDDDNEILKFISKNIKDIVVYQDSTLID